MEILVTSEMEKQIKYAETQKNVVGAQKLQKVYHEGGRVQLY